MRTAIKTSLPILVVLGLLVGFAHWKLAQQTPDGSWEYDLGEIEGSIYTARDTVLVNDDIGGAGWVALDARTGQRLAGEKWVTVHGVQIGENGWFAIRGEDGGDETTTVYDDTGKQIWQDRSESLAGARILSMAEDALVVITRDGRRNRTPVRTRIQKIDRSGDVLWRRPLTKGESGFGMTWAFRQPDEDRGDWISVPRVPAVTVGDRVVRLLDEDGELTGPEGKDPNTAVVGNGLITATADGTNCHFRAWSVSGTTWSTSAPCPGEKDPYLSEVIGGLMLVDAGDAGYFFVNTGNGEVTKSNLGTPHGFDPETLEALEINDLVAVRQHKSTFTGLDLDSGKKLWTHKGPGPTTGVLTRGKKNVYPGAEVSQDVVSIIGRTEPWWRLFAWGSSVPEPTATLLDGRTGDEIRTYRADELYTLTATDSALLMINDGVLKRFPR